MKNTHDNLMANPMDASILVVDDEAANVRLLEKILKLKGYNNVVTTQDPTQVLQLYRDHDSDVILTTALCSNSTKKQIITRRPFWS